MNYGNILKHDSCLIWFNDVAFENTFLKLFRPQKQKAVYVHLLHMNSCEIKMT